MKKLVPFLIVMICGFAKIPACAAATPVVIKSSSDLDKLWMFYSQEHDSLYIKQILEIINENDEMLFLAYESLNRINLAKLASQLQGRQVEPEMSDLRQILVKREVEQPGYQTKFLIVVTAMWSFDKQCMQDKQVGLDYQAVVAEYPELNYAEKINQILNQ